VYNQQIKPVRLIAQRLGLVIGKTYSEGAKTKPDENGGIRG